MKNHVVFRFAAGFALIAILLLVGCEHPAVNSPFFEKPTGDGTPAFPSLPEVIASDRMITVSWIAADGADSYEVYYNSVPIVPKNPAKNLPGTTTVISGLSNKTTYYVWVKAIYPSGTSALSSMAQGIPWPPNEVPQMPGIPRVIPGLNQLTVNWDTAGGADSYEVYLNTTPNTDSAVKNVTVTGTTTAVIKSLANEIIYYIWIKAKNANGESDFSLVESGTPRVPTDPPAAPAAPMATIGNKALLVSWAAVEMAESYEVWAGTSNNPANATKRGGDIGNGELFAAITGLSNGTAYYVWVKAKNSAGTSGFSPVSSGTPAASAAKPEEPGTPTVTLGNKQLTVQWTAVDGAASYEVWTGENDNSASATKHGADITGTSLTITSLSNGVTRYVWVKAKNSIGVSGFSPMASGTPSAATAIPAAPGAPTVTAGLQQLTVSWTAVEGASAYEVWAGISNDSAAATKRGDDVTSGLSAIISGLNNDTAYYVWVKAKNHIGTSGFSPAASGMPSLATLIPQGQPSPSISIGNAQLTVSWTAVEKASAYEVWTGASNNISAASKYGNDITNGLSVSIGSLTNGATYYVWVKAKNDIGESGFSASVSGKPIANAGTPDAIPGNGQIAVSWAVIAGAEEYEVYCGTGDNPPTTVSQTISAPATSTTISSLTNGTTYHVWIRGRNATGFGGISTMASAKPLADMGTVTVVPASGQLALSWAAVAGADQYEVYYSTSESAPGTAAQTVSTASANIPGLSNGTMYHVWVKGKNATGSNGISAMANGKPLAMPGTPTVVAGDGELSVSWTAAAGADEYEVYYGIGTPSILVATVGGTSTTITGLTNGTTYSVQVRGKNLTGSGEMSTAVSGRPTAGPCLYDGSIDTSHRLGMFTDLAAVSSYLSSNAVDGHSYYIMLGQDESTGRSPLVIRVKSWTLPLLAIRLNER
jgi:hypothetical protein